MKAIISQASASVVLYWLSLSKFGLFVFGTLCGSALAALSGMEWAEATTQTKVMGCLGAAVSFSATVGAFLDQSLKRAQEGKDPLTGLTPPPFATQEQVDAGISTRTMVSPATLAHTPLPPNP